MTYIVLKAPLNSNQPTNQPVKTTDNSHLAPLIVFTTLASRSVLE